MLDSYSKISGNKSLKDIRIIGSYDSFSYRLSGILSKNRRAIFINLREQLELGVRYFEMNLELSGETLNLMAGDKKTGLTFFDVQWSFKNFLESKPKEFILLKITKSKKSSLINWQNAIKRSMDISFVLMKVNQSSTLRLQNIRGKVLIIDCEGFGNYPFIGREYVGLRTSYDKIPSSLWKLALSEPDFLRKFYYGPNSVKPALFHNEISKQVFEVIDFYRSSSKEVLEKIYSSTGIHIFTFPERYELLCQSITEILKHNKNVERITG